MCTLHNVVYIAQCSVWKSSWTKLVARKRLLMEWNNNCPLVSENRSNTSKMITRRTFGCLSSSLPLVACWVIHLSYHDLSWQHAMVFIETFMTFLTFLTFRMFMTFKTFAIIKALKIFKILRTFYPCRPPNHQGFRDIQDLPGPHVKISKIITTVVNFMTHKTFTADKEIKKLNSR